MTLALILATLVTTTDACAIRYVANAGVLLESGARTFLIDAPIRDGIPPYAAPTAAERATLEGARPPYERVSAILVTHWHEDHFSAEAVAAHLRSNPAAVLVSSEEVVARARQHAADLPPGRFRAVTPAPGRSERVLVDGVPVHVLRIRHNPTRRLPAQHVGFLVEGCRTVLHTGDADPAADNFTLLRTLPRVEVGLLPFWYVLNEKNRAFVAHSIRPARVLGMHLPPADAADVGTRLAAVPDLQLLTAGTVIGLR